MVIGSLSFLAVSEELGLGKTSSGDVDWERAGTFETWEFLAGEIVGNEIGCCKPGT